MSGKRQLLRILVRNEKASAAVEFGMLAIPFTLMLTAILEVSLNGYSSQALDEVAQRVARQVQTGKVMAASMSQTQFKSMACGYLPNSMTCNSLTVSVQKINGSFYETASGGYGSDGTWQGDMKIAGQNGEPIRYCPGEAGSYVMIQMIYPSFRIIPFVTSGGGTIDKYIVTSAVVRNEPFTATGTIQSSGC